ncbi:protein of unknown function [Robiginitalea myxolifaciens]|uniref:DUF4369 domain-containing protein n=1 Tax=Robiginitalea myxolifaciens TaxID=400055 RepID=A0A1I6FNS2_9FLAO|nr:DUF4369 domain-containing protein [Robiginitalea myxolifaciens]SFR31603.1 protein of unknown function [Robiginitalea myxolifaciens]
MKNGIYTLLGLLLIVACSSEPKADELLVEGRVKGLKKGTLYLQQVVDTSLVSLDSTQVDAEGMYQLSTAISEPDFFYLYLDKADNNEVNDRILFFAEPGATRINSQWNAFENEAEISGSKSQEEFREYQQMLSRFNVQQLEYNRAALELDSLDSAGLDSLQQASDRLEIRATLYALNFAMNHKDSYLAPFVALSEEGRANPKMLDSIYNVLTPEVAESKYGRQLKALVEAQKAEN